ncbi:hypothetical protein B9T12_04585 [Wohlfahrtiimonas chitiniclastica]|nr:hypothetical protein B9T12_04585 [Wohlfahrtiimonas chitiniclastica]OYQ90456.1 hypothetical protein B9T10_03800 [Wohlfahrtiimonas chitiniclastica]
MALSLKARKAEILTFTQWKSYPRRSILVKNLLLKEFTYTIIVEDNKSPLIGALLVLFDFFNFPLSRLT